MLLEDFLVGNFTTCKNRFAAFCETGPDKNWVWKWGWIKDVFRSEWLIRFPRSNKKPKKVTDLICSFARRR
jgi:hypothetical protein